MNARTSIGAPSGCELGFRFGEFQFDPKGRRLFKNGLRVRIQPQPLAILLALVESPGSVITRDQLKQRLWGPSTYVEFEQGLNSAVSRLRDVLGDTAECPEFIETLPGEGYRFLSAVERLAPAHSKSVESQGMTSNSNSRIRSWWYLSIATAALIAAFLAGAYRPRKVNRSLSLHARDWVLISDFENRTGENALDGSVEYALQRELTTSSFLNVVPRERTNDSLRLMRKPLDTAITPAIGREICLRDGGIRTLLTGRVEKLGGTYLLSVQLVDPVHGATLTSIDEDAMDDRQIVSAIRRLSSRVREALGEEATAIHESENKLEKVTTPSLHALQLYSQASQTVRAGRGDGSSIQLLERALADDPNFPSAHLLLGYAYQSAGDAKSAKLHFQRSFDQANSTTDIERWQILGGYYNFVLRDRARAVDAYQSLLRLDPDNFVAQDEMYDNLRALGRLDEADRVLVRQADVRPRNLLANVTAAGVKATEDQDFQAAHRYLARASAIVAEDGEDADPEVATWIELFPAYEYWTRGEIERSHAEFLRVKYSIKTPSPSRIGWFHLAFGEFREAEKSFNEDPNPAQREEDLAVLALLRGNNKDLRHHLTTAHDYPAPGSCPSLMMISGGLPQYAEAGVRSFIGGIQTEHQRITLGELAFSHGEGDKAISILEPALQGELQQPSASFFLASESLSSAYQGQGKVSEALRVLEQSSSERTRTYNEGSFVMVAVLWMRNELALAHLYRKLGRDADAERAESELSRMLFYADSDNPIVRDLSKHSISSP